MACLRQLPPLFNSTELPAVNLTYYPRLHHDPSALLYKEVAYLVKSVLLPIVFSFGICGNTVNVVVFSQKRSRHGLDHIELSATLGLLSLSVSDLLFCTSGFPAAFLEKYTYEPGMRLRTLVSFYYTVYHKATMNLFLFTSTWLIVLVAAERYIAVCHPFRARSVIKVSRTLTAQSSVVVFAVLLNLPLFFEDYVKAQQCGTCECLMKAPGFMRLHAAFSYAHRMTWFTLGTFVPLLLLVFFNVCILFELFRVSHSAIAEPDAHSSSRITSILVAMIILFVLMVTPSMLLVFIADFIDFAEVSEAFVHNIRIAIVITNLTQAVKFSCNFLLYCSINKKFRETMSRGKCTSTSSTKSTSSFANPLTNRYHLVEISGRDTSSTAFSKESCYA